MSAKIFAGQWGHTHTITIVDQDDAALDVSGAATIEIIFTDPLGAAEAKTASLVTDGTDGKIVYTVTDGDTVDDQRGAWRREGRVTFADGKYYTTIDDYEVEAPLA